LLVGTPVADAILRDAAARAAAIRARHNVTPTLATVLVGSDSASAAYVRAKDRRCAQVGVDSRVVRLLADADTKQLLAAVTALAANESVHGILVQHPIPTSIDKRAAFEAIPLEKDVDGVNSASLGRLIVGLPAFPSCTPAGIMRLLQSAPVTLAGAHAVVVGRSPILGRPMASMLINAHATVTLCHSHTTGVAQLVAQADLVIAAVGKPRFIQGRWIQPGAVVIDAGYNEGSIGDVDFEPAAKRASLITPVPGGVGPMTIAMLLEHTVSAAERAVLAQTNASANA
jgi:methylenetetrahydrofolate dehydrogenase (NADP+)/methenyltetrahydrofolate cyclohydrolase